MARDGSWATASELADYAFCPRSHFYREHPPARGPTTASQVRSDAGRRFHERSLSGERRRAEHGGAYWAGLVLGVLLLLGGAAWLLHP
jgi:hypothetical protein